MSECGSAARDASDGAMKGTADTRGVLRHLRCVPSYPHRRTALPRLRRAPRRSRRLAIGAPVGGIGSPDRLKAELPTQQLFPWRAVARRKPDASPVAERARFGRRAAVGMRQALQGNARLSASDVGSGVYRQPFRLSASEQPYRGTRLSASDRPYHQNGGWPRSAVSCYGTS